MRNFFFIISLFASALSSCGALPPLQPGQWRLVTSADDAVHKYFLEESFTEAQAIVAHEKKYCYSSTVYDAEFTIQLVIMFDQPRLVRGATVAHLVFEGQDLATALGADGDDNELHDRLRHLVQKNGLRLQAALRNRPAWIALPPEAKASWWSACLACIGWPWC